MHLLTVPKAIYHCKRRRKCTSTTRILDPCESYLVQKYMCDPGNGKCHKLQKKTSQIITFAVLSRQKLKKLRTLQAL